ncbi:MAG TPA: integrin alpha, partial [Nannocystis sp.]
MTTSRRIPWLLSLTVLTACPPDTKDTPTEGSSETSTGAATEPTTGVPTGSDSSSAAETDPGDTQPDETDTDAAVCGEPALDQVIATGKPRARAGHAVAGAGDVNGDGVPDVIIGAPGGPSAADPNEPGRAFVVFGPAQQAELALGETQGLTLVGEAAHQIAGEVVEGIGDVNGDGRDD